MSFKGNKDVVEVAGRKLGSIGNRKMLLEKTNEELLKK